MNTPLIVTNTISIQGPASEVWDALTNPEKTRKYMFGCQALSDWKTGSPLLWKGQYEGKDMIFVKGIVKEIQVGKSLAYTTIDPNSSTVPDVPENYTTVTYQLREENGNTQLTVTQGDFSTVAEGEKRYKEVYNNGEGWQPILDQIKEMIEKK